MTEEEQAFPPPSSLKEPQKTATSWWKYGLVLLIGLCVGIGGFMGASALLHNGKTQESASSTPSTPEVHTASTPEKTASGETAPTEDTAAESDDAPMFPLEHKFCSRNSRVCLDYPDRVKLVENSKILGDYGDKYHGITSLADITDEIIVQIEDSAQPAAPDNCEGVKFDPPTMIEVIDSVPTKWQVTDAKGQNITVHAVKTVVPIDTGSNSEPVYRSGIYLTTAKELFKPGKLEITCPIVQSSEINLANSHVSIMGKEANTTKFIQYSTAEEARQEFSNIRYRMAWDILRSAKNL